jgi:two-component system, OmpR family, sensor histidine kinase MtrB
MSPPVLRWLRRGAPSAAAPRFAADISHELRTPLTTMLNLMELIRHHRAELPAAVREPVELLSEDLERFGRLVVDLLEISRDDGEDRRSREAVRIADLIREAADSAAGRPITQATTDAAGLTVKADKRRLERVIANLVENAEGHGGGCERVAVQAGGLGVIIQVDDAGPGVPVGERDRIFERFCRAGSERRPAQDRGIGLGLSIVARHVGWHHGKIRVEDRPGGGARFVLELPTSSDPVRRTYPEFRLAGSAAGRWW